MRPADQLVNDYDAGCKGTADIDMRELLWEIFADVQESYRLAMQGAGLAPATSEEIEGTVSDYLANNYGDW